MNLLTRLGPFLFQHGTIGQVQMLFQTVIVSLYHNLAVWVASGVQWKRMSEAFSRLVRKILTKDIAGADLFGYGAADFRPSGGQRNSGPSEDNLETLRSLLRERPAAASERSPLAAKAEASEVLNGCCAIEVSN